MKHYEEPTIEVEAFHTEDIITTSGTTPGSPSTGDAGLPIV